MKTIKKISFLILVLTIITACSKSEESTNAGNCATECEYTIASTETLGTVPSSLDGTYELTYHSATSDSPYTNGTKATFTVSNNMLTVAIDGKECITIKNPVLLGSNNYKFKDSCRDNIAFNLSPNNDGSFNEINVEPLGIGWFGQFSQ